MNPRVLLSVVSLGLCGILLSACGPDGLFASRFPTRMLVFHTMGRGCDEGIEATLTLSSGETLHSGILLASGDNNIAESFDSSQNYPSVDKVRIEAYCYHANGNPGKIVLEGWGGGGSSKTASNVFSVAPTYPDPENDGCITPAPSNRMVEVFEYVEPAPCVLVANFAVRD